mmetsp:Transcript_11150/g.19625  ORF Transcript_11150/g.19625 Transcript_11150/m.19625 type:complete len:106 (+) Transcript_11150:18-335(+)
MVVIIVRSLEPRLPCARSFRIVTTSSALFESSPEVGSSTKRTAGFDKRSMAIETRFRWPPLTPRSSGPPILTSRQDVRFSDSTTFSTRFALTSSDILSGSTSCDW